MNNFNEIFQAIITVTNTSLNAGVSFQEVYGAVNAASVAIQEAYFKHLADTRLMIAQQQMGSNPVGSENIMSNTHEEKIN